MQRDKQSPGSSHSFWSEALIEGAIHTAAEWMGGVPASMTAALLRFGSLNEGEDDIVNAQQNEALRRMQASESQTPQYQNRK